MRQRLSAPAAFFVGGRVGHDGEVRYLSFFDAGFEDVMKNEDGPFGPQLIWVLVGVGAALFFGFKFLQPAPAPGERVAMLRIEGGSDTRHERVSAQDCKSRVDRIWVETDEFVECIAYVVGGQDIDSRVAVVFFNGDVPQADLAAESTEAVRGRALSRAESVAGATGLKVVVMGRPGLMGSTGFHRAGGMRDDAYVMSIALDRLRERLQVQQLALAGQSGGARLIAQMLVLGRGDVMCSAMASGAYDIPQVKGGGTVRTNIFGEPGRRYLVPMTEIAKIPVTRERRQFVIGDPNDKITGFPEQRAWAERLLALGHPVLLIEARGGGKDNHGLSDAAVAVAAACAKGATDGDITTLAQRAR
ncbi:MAG: hypothetical protein ABL898_15505 [Hyphomicrobiaceae bacterium]|nr:hypothetical protein [Hyphomicrobiaceae bacterium]